MKATVGLTLGGVGYTFEIEEKTEIETLHKELPSPFSFNLIMQGHADLMKIEDKLEFLRRMHSAVLERIKS